MVFCSIRQGYLKAMVEKLHCLTSCDYASNLDERWHFAICLMSGLVAMKYTFLPRHS